MADNKQTIQSGTRGNSAALRLHIAGRQRPTTPTGGYNPDANANSQKTYELNTGSKTYTLSQKQYDGLRQIYKSTWADAYAFDDEDQQRKAAGLVPRSYAQNYQNNKLDNWLLENDLPSAKYLDKYLEAYNDFEAEQQAYQNKAEAKSSLYQNAARASVELELQGIYNDEKLYDWNGEQRTGKDIHTNAFFDLLNSGDYSDAYVFDNSALDKEKTDFETTAEWREYQLRQAAKSFDQQKDWDDATSISYNDYLQNYSASLDKQLKAQKVVGDAMGRTWGDAITYNEDLRNREAYAALTSDAAVDEFVANNQDDPAAVIAEMYEYGVDQGKIGRAKNQFTKNAATDEEKNAIKAAFASGKQARKDAERQTRDQQQAAADGVRDIFHKTVKYNGGGADADSLAQAVEAARAAGYNTEDIASVAADLRRELAQGGMLSVAADGVLAGAIHPEREANADADAVVKSVQESYTQSTTELSPVTPEQVANVILSSLEYQGNRVTDESVQAGMDAAIASGASYSVLREAADMALSQLERARTVDNGGSRVPGAYTGDFTTREIMDNALASAKKEDETLLAAATRKALEEKGYTAFEIDQTFRRNGWSGLLDDEEAARNYFIDVALPREAEADPDGWGGALGDLTPEQYATLYWDNMTEAERAEYVASFKESSGYNTDLHRTHGEQAIAQFAMIVPRVLTGIASGAVNLADMAEGVVSGRTDRWEASKALSEASAFAQNLGRSVNQDAASDFIAGANDVATELLRMYALNAAGTGLSKALSGMGTATAAVPGAATASAAVTGASSKGLGKVLDIAKKTFSAQSAPFLATAMGGYYAEAMESGATRQQATLYGLVAGTFEGALESLNVDNWINNRIGGGRFIKQVQAAGRNALRQGYANGMRLIGLASSALGEGAEEGASYLVSTLMQKATFDPNAEISGSEMLEQAGMGALIGILGAGVSVAGNPQAYTETVVLHNYLAENGYNANVADALLASVQYDLMDENTRATAEKNPAILSIEDYRSHMTTIEQAGKAMETAEKNLRSVIENGTADVEARRATVTQLSAQLQAVDLTTEEGRAAAAKLSQELTAAKGRLENAIATSNSAVQKARDARSHTYTQNQRATEKARAELNSHFVSMRNLLMPQVRAMEEAGLLGADAQTTFEAQFADVMASLRAGVAPETVDTTEWDAYAAESLTTATGQDSAAQDVLAIQNYSISENGRAPESENEETKTTTPDLGADAAAFETISAEAQAEALDLGDKLGVPVVFVDMPDGISGEYADGEIRINKRQPAGENVAKVVLRHELTHYIEGSDAYAEFSNFVVQLAQRLNPDMNINAVYQGIIDDYAARGKTLDEPGARKEFVAYFVQSELLQNERSIQMLVNEKSGIAGRVLNWIRYQIDKLKLRGSNNAVALELLEAERLYAKAFFKASGKSSSSGESQYAIVRDKQHGYRVIADQGVYMGMDTSEQLPIVKDIIKGLRGQAFTSLVDGETMSVAKKNVVAQKLYRPGEAMKGEKYNARLSTASVIGDAMAASQQSKPDSQVEETHSTFKTTSRGERAVIVEIPVFDKNGELVDSYVYDVKLVKISNEREKIVYDISRINKLKNPHSELLFLKDSGTHIDRGSIAGIIRDKLEVVNTENAGQNSFSNSTWQQMIDKYGAKRPGMEPRVRDEAVPERASNTQRVSDFLRSFVESDKATAEMVDEVKQAVEAGDFGVYTEQSNRQTQSIAQSAISRKGQIKAAEDFHADVAANRINAETVATGLQLLAEASQRGDTDTTLSLLADLCICSTETGRGLQAFSMLKKMGGVGSAYYMERLEERLNRKYEREIASGKILPIKIDGTLMRNLAEAKTADEIEAAEAAIAENLGQQLPLTLQQKMSNWRYFSMLANPTTHIRNTTGNALMSGIRGAKDVVATGIERVFVRDSADRAHAIYSKANQADRIAYAEQSFEANKRDLTSGGKYGFETFMKQNQRLFDNKLLNKAAQLNFQALEGEDAIFLKMAYRDAMVQYMVAQDLDPAAMTKAEEAKAVAWASDQAWKATFRDASQVATLLNRVSKVNTAAKVIVEGVMPFKKTPINIAKRGIEYSPIGLIQGIYQLTAGVKSGKYTVAQGIDRLASGITGAGLLALGALLGKLGILRGQGEEDEKYETFLQSTGEQAYSLNIGDVSIGISGLAPATIPLFMGVSLFESIDREEAFDMSALIDVLASTTDPLMEMSFMSSLNAALESYNRDGLGGALGQVAWSAAPGYVSQHIPTFTGKVGQFLDPYTRTSKADSSSALGGTLDSFLRSTLKKIPGASSAVLEPYVDVSGEVQQKTAFSEWATDFLNKFVSPGTIKIKDRNRVDAELVRLVESTGETDFLPSYGRKYFTVDGKRYDMNANQYTEYSVARGEACYAAVKKIIQTSAYKNATDEQKSKMLSKAVQNAVDVVNDQYKDKLGAYDD